eukprot:scaffold1828_cov272-Chaetoceros_neogracile.AAC.7
MASIQTDLHGNRLSNSPPHSKDGGQTSETDGEEEDTPSCVIKNPYKKRTTTLQHPPSHQDEIKEHCSPPFTDDDDDDNISEMEDLLKSSSTNQSRRGAVVHFDRFADVSKSCKFDNLDPSSTNFDLEAISEKFCIYLLELKMDNGNYYAADSLPQFLSGWVNALKKKKEFNAFLKSPSSLDWYKNMWSDLRTRARTNAFYRGDTAKHNKCYLRRHTVAKITMFYLKNPVRKQDSKGWEDMAITNVLRQAVGRAGEIGYFNWNDSCFESDDQCFQNTWFQPKTARSFVITCGDKMLTPGKNEQTWIFPSLHNMKKENVSKTVTKMLKRCVGHVEGVFKSTTSHHIRYGATDDMSAHVDLDVVAILQRGAWYFESESAGFIYIAKRRNDLMCAKALGGHDNLKDVVLAPTIDFLGKDLSDDKMSSLVRVMKNLFQYLPHCQTETDSLFSYRSVMMGAVLENLNGIIKDLGRHNSFCDAVIGAAMREGIVLHELSEWGGIIHEIRKKDMNTKNSNRNGEQSIKLLHAEVSAVKDQLADSKQSITAMAESIQELMVMVAGLNQQKPSSMELAASVQHPDVTIVNDINSAKRTSSVALMQDNSVTDSDPVPKKSKVNAFEHMRIAALSKGSPKNFRSWTSIPLKAMIKKIVEEDVEVMSGKDPLGLDKDKEKKAAKNEVANSTKVLRFLATMCGSAQEVMLFCGQKSNMFENSKMAKLRQKEIDELRTNVVTNVITWIHTHHRGKQRKTPLTIDTITAGNLRPILEACKDDEQKNKWTDWDAVKCGWKIKKFVE